MSDSKKYGGSINTAGGAFAEKEQAIENQYFRKKDAEKMEKLIQEMRSHVTELQNEVTQLKKKK